MNSSKNVWRIPSEVWIIGIPLVRVFTFFTEIVTRNHPRVALVFVAPDSCNQPYQRGFNTNATLLYVLDIPPGFFRRGHVPGDVYDGGR